MIPPNQQGQRRWLCQLLLAAGIVTGLAFLAILHATWSGEDEAPPDPARQAAWDKITPHLAAADETSARAADKYALRLREFFAERKAFARPFAEDVLSWSGKWAFLKSKSPWGSDGEYQQFLRESFERHVFKEDDLARLLKAAVEGYASELSGIENQTLLAIRADLDDTALAQRGLLPAVQSDDAFREAVDVMMAKVLAVISQDVAFTAGRELTSFIASDIATNITLEILATVASSLGVEAGIFSSGLVSGAATLGIGLVAAIVADQLLDWIMSASGYDPAGEIASKVCGSLDSVQALLLDGDPESGKGGLVRELAKLRQQRSSLRREALQKLILEGGVE